VYSTRARVHARIPNGRPREEKRASDKSRRTSRFGSWRAEGRPATPMKSVSVSVSVSVPWNLSLNSGLSPRSGLCYRLCLCVYISWHSTTPTPTPILARILADTSDTRDFLKLFLWQAERHADILAAILARMSARMSTSVSASWNSSYTAHNSLIGVAIVQSVPKYLP